VQAAGLRFPEGPVVPLEDGIFMARAYLLASRISTLGDDEHYYYRRADVERGNLSRSRTHPDDYAHSIATIMDIVRELDPDPDRANRIILGLYRRKALMKFFRPGRFDRYGPRHQHRCVTAIQRLASSHVPPALDTGLPEPHRARSRAVRSGDVNALIVLAGSTPWRSRRRWLRTRLRTEVKRAARRIPGNRKPSSPR
jgi:hypothetical protein